MKVALHAPPLHAQRQHCTDIVLRRENPRLDDRLPDGFNLRYLRHRRGVVDHLDDTIGTNDLIDHGRRRRDQIEIVLALETLLDDLHMQQAEKPAAKPEAQRL